MTPLYEDNHIIIVYKRPGEIVQGDKTGDRTLIDDVKQYIKDKYQKTGNVFLGVPHRLDRPVGGVVIFARTSKALSRLTEMFRQGEVHKTYWAITKQLPEETDGTITSYLLRNEAQNKSFSYTREVPKSKRSVLQYSVIGRSKTFYLLQIHLLTGRHHQIRCQLASIGCPIKGDLKYGFPRSNKDGSISLLAHDVEFIHPVRKTAIHVEVPLNEGSEFLMFEPF